MPMISTREIARSKSSEMVSSSASTAGGASRARPRIVSESERGCSWISLSMKWR